MFLVNWIPHLNAIKTVLLISGRYLSKLVSIYERNNKSRLNIQAESTWAIEWFSKTSPAVNGSNWPSLGIDRESGCFPAVFPVSGPSPKKISQPVSPFRTR